MLLRAVGLRCWVFLLAASSRREDPSPHEARVVQAWSSYVGSKPISVDCDSG